MMASLELLELLFMLGFGFCQLFQQFNVSANILTETKYPCAFVDTVNITGRYYETFVSDFETNHSSHSGHSGHSKQLSNHTTNNGNIVIGGNATTNTHDWMPIPRELVAIYDFVIRNGVRTTVARHLRACACKLKPCIRFCCAEGYYYDVINHTCIAMNIINDTLDQHSITVRGTNGSSYAVSIAKHFIVQTETPCDQMRSALTDHKELIQWILLENGTIAYKHHHFTKHYCYSPYRLKNSTWIWQPLACPVERLPFLLGVREWTYVISLILTTICMAIIFCMHICCTEIRNTFYGAAIKAYSLCIIIGYCLMIHLVITDPTKMTKSSCRIIPCFVLLCLLLSFYILTFISLNFYLSFHGIVLTKLMFWLIFFPIASLAVGWSLYVGLETYGGKHVFGADTCWFDPRNWAIMIYLNAPIFVACSLSVFFYILTLISIREQQESGSKSSTTTLEDNRYNSFWQFFSYTFVTWLVWVISFVINFYRHDRTHINYVVCIVVILHGFGSLYTLIGKNQQIQNFLRRIEDGIDEDDEEVCERAFPMTQQERK